MSCDSNSTEESKQSTMNTSDDAKDGLFGNKQKLKSLMDKAKNEYLSQHKDLVDEYLKTHPNANTLEVLNHVRTVTESMNTGSGISLNCLFILFVGIILIITLRIQYNFYVEELIISSLFFSLNPSIDINLLLNDLPLKIDECKYFKNLIKNDNNNEYKKWINTNKEYCDFLGQSINRKLLYIYEYSSNQYKQNSNNLNQFIEWIMDETFNISKSKKTKRNKRKKGKYSKLMPLRSIQSKEDIQYFILSHLENIKTKWNVYINKMEKRYAKQSKIDLNDVLYRLGMEMNHYIFTNSLYFDDININNNKDDESNKNKQIIIKDIINAINGYLEYEYFRDGFICILNEKNNKFVIDFVTIHQLIDNKKIKNYLNFINKQQMICINTFESIGRFKNEIKIYLKIIQQSFIHWITFNKINNGESIEIIDKNKEIKQKLSEFKDIESKPKAFWNGYEWLKGNELSIESLVIHDKLIHSTNYEKFNDLLQIPMINKKENEFIDIKYYMKQLQEIQNKNNNKLALFYSNSYLFHEYIFNQFQTKEMKQESWSKITELIIIINKQFGSVSNLIQEMVQYIDQHYIYNNPGFLWILCDNQHTNNTLYFQYTMRYNLLSNDILLSDHGILMGVDLWSHSYSHDFIKGYKLKQIEYQKIKKQKYKTTEIIGQSIDITHIGTSLQKTFNYPRTQMEIIGYYINALIHNLDWIQIAKRWESQCKNKRNQYKQQQNTETEKIKQNHDIIKPQHEEL